jgi:hypothetical protein
MPDGFIPTATNLAVEKSFFFVLGWVGYVDKLGIYRMTHFCRRYNVSLKRFLIVRDEEYENCD